MPRLTARHVFDWLMEAGPAEAGGMGQAPLSWREIDAWVAQTHRRPAAWETILLHRASAAYLGELHAAEDHTRPAPWAPRGVEIDHNAAERQLRAVLG